MLQVTIGQKINRLTAVRFVRKSRRKPVWLFHCVCNRSIETDIYSVLAGRTVSCGCYSREQKIKFPPRLRHGMNRKNNQTRFYRIWAAMKRRCNNVNQPSYARYGGKGIKVCEGWGDFDNFLGDMLESYTEHVSLFGERQTTLDRIDGSGPYCLNNCRWATYSQQNLNKTKNKLLN